MTQAVLRRMAVWILACCIGLAWSADVPGSSCIPVVSYLPLDAEAVGTDSNGIPALGTYERISPDGRFVLRSFSGRRLGEVSLMELSSGPDGRIRAYRTPLSNEAFPVQGSWRYLVDVDGRHFRLRDVLRSEEGAKPLFQGGMRGFYAAASELDARQAPDPSLIWIRSMSWPQGDRSGQGTGPLQVRTIAIRDDGRSAEVVSDTGPQFICSSRQAADGGVYTLPMISVDGREFAAIPINPRVGQPSMRVYGLSAVIPGADHGCEPRVDLLASPGKAVFAFPGRASAMLAYTDNASVYFVDRRSPLQDQVFRIDDERTQVLASAFPGFTRDGRIVFGATWQDCTADRRCENRAGYVVADPYQNADYRQQVQRLGLSPEKACITHADVQRERRHFASERELAP
ncbi:hypothetical protein [Hydrogenophaga flava]|uniref:hypothetical protein n=1 Tax=Hydrogenophaga flava TaxID=65657 RepID=UPI000824802C|nr:hypothetical protein [Hydrogenophaga flava]